MIKSILSAAKKYKKAVMVDPKEKNFIEYKKVKLIKPNLKEAEFNWLGHANNSPFTKEGF